MTHPAHRHQSIPAKRRRFNSSVSALDALVALDGGTLIWFDPADWTKLAKVYTNINPVTELDDRIGYMEEQGGSTYAAIQSDPADRMWAQGRYIWGYTGDTLTTTLPDMGIDATVAYLDQDGPQFLTGQTISGATSIPLVDKLGPLIYIDRALSLGETEAVRQFLQSRGPL